MLTLEHDKNAWQLRYKIKKVKPQCQSHPASTVVHWHKPAANVFPWDRLPSLREDVLTLYSMSWIVAKHYSCGLWTDQHLTEVPESNTLHFKSKKNEQKLWYILWHTCFFITFELLETISTYQNNQPTKQNPRNLTWLQGNKYKTLQK